MKIKITRFFLFLLVVALAACKDDQKKSTIAPGTASPDSSKLTNADSADTSAGSNLTGFYLEIKNALADDNGGAAATAAKSFIGELEKRDSLDENLQDAKEMAEHISTNKNDIEHQRFHFQMLSDDMYDLLKRSTRNKPLYQDFCPMYRKNKGATWLSETEDIRNPYLGKKMPSCGEIKEVLK